MLVVFQLKPQTRSSQADLLGVPQIGRRERGDVFQEKDRFGMQELDWPPDGGWQNLLGKDKAVVPLVKFLQATKIGARDGINERSREWEIKVDGEGEDDPYRFYANHKLQRIFVSLTR